MGNRKIGSLAVVFLLIFPQVASSVGASEGAIKGRIVNRTSAESSVADVKITLHEYIGDTEAEQLSATTDKNGAFQFRDLSTELDRNYYVSLNYQGAEYESEMMRFDEGETLKILEIPVYDSMVSDEEIEVKMQHIILGVGEGALLVREFLEFENRGDRAYIGSEEVSPEKRGTLKFSVPEGSQELQVGSGLMSCCVVLRGGKLFDTMALKPGEKQVVFSYKIRYGSSKYAFRRLLDYDTEILDLFVQDVGIKVESDRLISRGTLGGSEGQYIHLSGGELKRGEELEILLSNLPKGGLGYKWIVLVAAIAVFGFGWSFLRGRGERDRGLVARRAELMESIAELDDRFEAGGMSREDYKRERSRIKGELMAIVRQLEARRR